MIIVNDSVRINKIKVLVSAGAAVYAGNDGYKVVKHGDDYYIDYNHREYIIGLHGMANTPYANKLNMTRFYTYAANGEQVEVTA